VTKVDELTIRVVTPEIYAPFLYQFGTTPIMPQHILAKTVANGTFASAYGGQLEAARYCWQRAIPFERTQGGAIHAVGAQPVFSGSGQEGSAVAIFDNVIFTVVPDMNALTLRF